VFAAGPLPTPIPFRGTCSGDDLRDMWTRAGRELATQGAELLIVLNGSPFEVGKVGVRQRLAARGSGNRPASDVC